MQTLVATVIADKPAAEKASDAELCAIAKRLTAVRFYLVFNDYGSSLSIFLGYSPRLTSFMIQTEK